MPACRATGCWATRCTGPTGGCGRCWRRAAGRPHLLAIGGGDKLWSELEGRIGQHKPEDRAKAMPEGAWRRLSAGAGAKGERPFDWARVRLVRRQEPPWEHRLLVRRSLADPGDLAYFVVSGPATARLIDSARVAGRRWIVEECFEAAAQEVGSADYGVRGWHGRHRHVSRGPRWRPPSSPRSAPG